MTCFLLADKETERIVYAVRTEKGFSGGPVFMTFRNGEHAVVGIHCRGGEGGKYNYGTLLSPFLEYVHHSF